MIPPLDLTALARDYFAEHFDDSPQVMEFWSGEIDALTKSLTLSHTAGRAEERKVWEKYKADFDRWLSVSVVVPEEEYKALLVKAKAGRVEGLMEAAKWHEDIADSIRQSYGDKDAVREEDHRRYARGFRATRASDPAPGDQVAECRHCGAPTDFAKALSDAETKGGDDLANEIDGIIGASGLIDEPGSLIDVVMTIVEIAKLAPAHPTVPGEVERLRKVLQTARDQVVAAMLPKYGPDIAVAAVAYIEAALSTSQPKGETE